MPTSMSKSKSKPKPTSTTHLLELAHLYDAAHHIIANTTGLWGPITLPSDLLPRVISFLDPSVDLATLLAVQRCSTFAWKSATPMIYEQVTVVDWSKLLCLPKGKVPPTEAIDLAEPPHLDEAQSRSIQRRREAFGCTVNMTIHAFPTLGDWIAFVNLTGDGLKLSPDRTITPSPSTMTSPLFPKLVYLHISERAMEPLCHGGDFADRYLNPNHSSLSKLDEIFPIFLGSNSRICKGCIVLPNKPKYTKTYGLQQLLAGNKEYGVPSRDGSGGMELKPSRTERSKLLLIVLESFAEGATVSIHNMTDLWINYLSSQLPFTFHLFYSASDVKIPAPQAGQLVGYRSFAYLRALRWGPIGRRPKVPCRTTWTITGECNWASDPEYYVACTEGLVGGIFSAARMEGRMHELEMFEATAVQDPRVRGEVLARLGPGTNGKVKRMKFVNPGEEKPCSFCGRL